MKRIWSLLIVAVFAICLSGCGENRENDVGQTQGSQKEQTVQVQDSQQEWAESTVSGEEGELKIQVGKRVLTADLVSNSSSQALKEALTEKPITIDMQDYGDFEKVGSLGMDLPTNDEQITTEAGDLILYQGNSFVIYYNTNSWNFTRLGKINGVSAEELKDILGNGDVTVTLSLKE